MDQGLGLVVALPVEIRALLGRCGRRRSGGVQWQGALATDLPLTLIRSGPGTQNAAAAACDLVSRGMGMLGSVGISGGLSPEVSAGDLILAHDILERTGNTFQRIWRADSRFLAPMYTAIQTAGLCVHQGTSVTVQRPVLTREEKAACFRETGALAADMESAAVARQAEAAGLPFFALRAVCDPVWVSLPPFIPDCLDQRGEVRLLYLGGRLFKRPFSMLRLIRMQRGLRKALTQLKRAWQGPLREVLPKLLADHP